MALVIKDRVKETTTSTGTGSITLAGAEEKYIAFGSVLSNSDTVYYAIEHSGSGVDEWEVGIGTYTSSTDSISRDTILSSSNSGSAVNFSVGTKTIFATYPADKAIYEDASGNVDVSGNITVGGTVDGRDLATDGTKLDGIEANADVTDTTNVTAAGALMDSEVTNLAQVKAFDSSDYATAAQGTTADNALPKAGGTMTGAITFASGQTFDGRDVSADGTKLDGIESGATADQTAAEIRSLVDSATDSNVFTDADHTKLDGIETGATADQTASEILTAIKTVDGAASGLDADLLDGNHASAFATSSQGTLADSAVQPSDNISTLTNDSGYITGNQTITLSGDVSGSGTTSITVTVADDSHNHVISNIDGLQTALDNKLDDTQKGAANGLAELDSSGKVPSSQLPSYVDDVLEYSSSSSFPATGETGKLYVDLTTNDVYRWTGSTYVKVSDAVSTADQANQLATARTISLTGDVSGSTSFDGSSNVSITATVADDSHNHTISNVDGLQTALDAKADDSTTITAGSGLTGGGSLGANRTINVGAGTGVTVNANDVAIGQDVSTTANVTFNNITVSGTVDGRDVAADGTKLDGIESGATADQTITAGTGLTGGGTGNVTLSHADTSSQASVNNSGGTVIQDVTLDTYGHVTGLVSYNLDGRYYTETEADSRFVNATGDTMTGSLNIGAAIGSRSNTISVDGDANSSPIVVQCDTIDNAWGVLPYTGGETYIHGGVYYDDGTWVHRSSNTTNYLLRLNGGSGAGWYASNNSSGSWNVVNNASLWNSSGTWVGAVAKSPTLTLSGDVSGSATFTNLGNATLSVTVADDSHNHTIANVDGLQTALDGKLSTTGKAADSELLDGVNGASYLRSDADDNVTGHTEWQDNYQVRFGNSADFRIYHNGSHNYIRNYNHSAGNIYIQGENTSGTNQGLIYGRCDAARTYVQLYENSVERLRTVSDGVDIYGSLDASGSVEAGTADGGAVIRDWQNNASYAMFGTANMTGSEYSLITDGTQTYLGSGTGGSTHIRGPVNSSTAEIRVTSAEIILDSNSVVIPRYITHEGDTDTYLDFVSADAWRVVTGGTEGLRVSGSNVDIPSAIRHTGDTNTYMQFHAADQWRVVTGGTERLEVKNSSPHVLVTGDLNSTSDARLKENVEPIANALSDVTQLEGVSFDWKDTGTRGHGFIAQQVEPILPDVVQTDEETGIKSINYVGMIGHLVEAIKEQQTQIDALKAEIEEMKS